MKTRNKIIIQIILFMIILSNSSCATSVKTFDRDSNQIRVTTTTSMIADLVREIGQSHVQVIGLMGPGVDPHLYKPSFGDMRKIDESQIIFYNGLYLEGKMEGILRKISKMKPVIAVSDDIPQKQLRSSSKLSASYDPHIWFDIQLWIQASHTVKEALINIDPMHRNTYESNANTYISELYELEQYVRAQLSLIPESSKILITSHDAFGYFGDAYQIQVRGLQGMSTVSEFGARDVIELREYIIENKIRTVFLETSLSKKSILAVIEGAKSKGHEVSIGGSLYSDALGPENSLAGTYIGMIRHNVDTIVSGLR